MGTGQKLTLAGVQYRPEDLSALVLRSGPDGPSVTDSGNWILDAQLGSIPDPVALATTLDGIAGVVEHGLFIGLADAAILAADGGLRILGRLD